jgi:outer membrane PBP1 activator LpoA protein
MFGCATAPEPDRTTKIENKEPIEAPIADGQDQVQNIIEQFSSTNDLNLLESSLLTLAQDYQKEQDCLSSVTVMNTALQLPISEQSKVIASIIRSECKLESYLRQQHSFDVQQLIKENAALQNTYRFDNNVPDQWQSRKALTEAFLSGINQDYVAALTNLLEYRTPLSPLMAFQHQVTFAWLSQLPAAERQTLMLREPDLLNYLELINIIENKNVSDANKQRKISQWMQSHPNAELSISPPATLQKYLDIEIEAQQSIAIILPLSGRLAGQGDAIKQGILAGYYDQIDNNGPTQQATTLTFIDSGSEQLLNSIINEESLAGFDVIVGPLLKSHLSQVDVLASPATLRIFLNEADNLNAMSVNSLKNYFALSPEQEAIELAAKMRAQNIRHPILIHDNSSITNRMAEAFLLAWANTETQPLTPNPSRVEYADNTSMRAGITSALDVLQSQQRINQMANLSTEKVLSVTRNRRDVDAFVVFAKPNEVELINPIIESSMSLFTGEQLPVFATSYSYNHKKNRNSLRDLRNLVFVDMPFVLPEGRESTLARQADTLFNEPSSSFLRLFSFGYDAVQLSAQALSLRIFNHLTSNGLTGTISINKNGIVQRELSALSIQNQ